jgi:small-conductance mechanosensitive channel
MRPNFHTFLGLTNYGAISVEMESVADSRLPDSLLGPIKSQGVKELQDSAIVMRIKFKTKPGEQFIIKREVFDRLQKAFEKAGIEFAHRHVIVRLPHEPADLPR